MITMNHTLNGICHSAYLARLHFFPYFLSCPYGTSVILDKKHCFSRGKAFLMKLVGGEWENPANFKMKIKQRKCAITAWNCFSNVYQGQCVLWQLDSKIGSGTILQAVQAAEACPWIWKEERTQLDWLCYEHIKLICERSSNLNRLQLYQSWGDIEQRSNVQSGIAGWTLGWKYKKGSKKTTDKSMCVCVCVWIKWSDWYQCLFHSARLQDFNHY